MGQVSYLLGPERVTAISKIDTLSGRPEFMRGWISVSYEFRVGEVDEMCSR